MLAPLLPEKTFAKSLSNETLVLGYESRGFVATSQTRSSAEATYLYDAALVVCGSHIIVATNYEGVWSETIELSDIIEVQQEQCDNQWQVRIRGNGKTMSFYFDESQKASKLCAVLHQLPRARSSSSGSEEQIENYKQEILELKIKVKVGNPASEAFRSRAMPNTTLSVQSRTELIDKVS